MTEKPKIGWFMKAVIAKQKEPVFKKNRELNYD